MHIVVLVEKPSIAQILSRPIAEYYSDEFQIQFISTLSISNIPFKYPANLAYKSYPLVQDVEYQFNFSDEEMSAIANADIVLCISDFNCSTIHKTQMLLESIFNQKIDSLSHVKQICLTNYSDSEIQSKLNNHINDDMSVPVYVNGGKVKAYFDYNFNINSMGILSKLYSLIQDGSYKGNVFISKYMLQVLIYLHTQNNSNVSIDFFKMAHQWKGTGKYNKENQYKGSILYQLGSCISITKMMNNLVDLNLIRVESKNHKEIVTLTEQGILFCDRLHKDCTDLDLPFRLGCWMNEPFDIVKPKIDIYLHSFFLKQKNKMNKEFQHTLRG